MHHDSSGGLEPFSTRDRTLSTLFFSFAFRTLLDGISSLWQTTPSFFERVSSFMDDGKGGRVGYR